MLFGAEGVVTAAQSRHVQAGCRAASLLHGVTLLRKMYGLYLSPQHLSKPLGARPRLRAAAGTLRVGGWEAVRREITADGIIKCATTNPLYIPSSLTQQHLIGRSIRTVVTIVSQTSLYVTSVCLSSSLACWPF